MGNSFGLILNYRDFRWDDCRLLEYEVDKRCGHRDGGAMLRGGLINWVTNSQTT